MTAMHGSYHLEFSPRLRTSLGRCHPERSLIRVHLRLQTDLAHLYAEVLCHELAHLAVYRLHGPRARPHGPEWRRLVEQAGHKPRRLVFVEAPEQTTTYLHRCPVCQNARVSRRRNPRWRCATCVRDGLEGGLIIEALVRG